MFFNIAAMNRFFRDLLFKDSALCDIVGHKDRPALPILNLFVSLVIIIFNLKFKKFNI